MSHSTRSYTSRRRWNTTAKLAVLVAALGIITVVLEQPRLTASPSRDATVEQSIQPADGGGAVTGAAAEQAVSVASPTPAAEELLPPTL